MRCVVTDELFPPHMHTLPMSQACFIRCGDFHHPSTQHHAATTSLYLSLTTHLTPHSSMRAATIPYRTRNTVIGCRIIGWHESSCDNDYRMESSLRKTIPKPTQELLLHKGQVFSSALLYLTMSLHVNKIRYFISMCPNSLL